MALDTDFKIERDNAVSLSDGTPTTPVTLALGCVTSHTINLPEKEDIVFRCRGTVNGSREGDDVVFDFDFTEHWKEYTNAAVGVSRDFMLKRNAYSGNASTNTNHEKNAFDLLVTTDKTSGQTTDPLVTFSDCVLLSSTVSPAPDGITVTHSVRCYGGFAETGEA